MDLKKLISCYIYIYNQNNLNIWLSFSKFRFPILNSIRGCATNIFGMQNWDDYWYRCNHTSRNIYASAILLPSGGNHSNRDACINISVMQRRKCVRYKMQPLITETAAFIGYAWNCTLNRCQRKQAEEKERKKQQRVLSSGIEEPNILRIHPEDDTDVVIHNAFEMIYIVKRCYF